MNGQPKAPFYIVLLLVVAGLLAFAAFRSDIFAPKAPNHEGTGKIDPNAIGQTAEAKDSNTVTTVKEYTFKPAERLPDVKGTSAYKPLQDNTVRFALNVWAGWGPIILANDGFKPGKIWKTAKGDEFKVELVLIDNPVAMRDAYAAGEVHIGWATLDMVPLVHGRLRRQNGPTARQPRHAAHLSADRLVERRRRHRRSRGDQNSRRSARQEGGARSEFTVALFPVEHARLRRRAAERSEYGVHRRRLPSGRRVQLPKRIVRRRFLVARYLQSGRGQRQPHARDHANRQQADCRRLVRPRRFRQGPRRQDRSHRPRHLRRHGGAQEGRSKGALREAHGRRLQHSGQRHDQNVRRRPQHQLGRELSVLLEPEQPHEFRTRVGRRRIISTAVSARSRTSRCRSTR